MLLELYNVLGKRRDEAWDEMAKMFGYESFHQVKREGKSLRLSYIRQSVSLIEEEVTNEL